MHRAAAPAGRCLPRAPRGMRPEIGGRPAQRRRTPSPPARHFRRSESMAWTWSVSCGRDTGIGVTYDPPMTARGRVALLFALAVAAAGCGDDPHLLATDAPAGGRAAPDGG